MVRGANILVFLNLGTWSSLRPYVKTNVLSILLFSLVGMVRGANILVFHNLGTRSHLNMVFPIVEGLLGEHTYCIVPEHRASLGKTKTIRSA